MLPRHQSSLRSGLLPVDSSRGVGSWLADASACVRVVRFCLPVILAMGFLCLAPPANADFISFSASGVGPVSGTNLGATATFALTGSMLSVTLSNTGDATRFQADVLTALFFDIQGAPSLTKETASLPEGRVVQWTGDYDTGSEEMWSGSPVSDVSGEWAFGYGLSGAPGGANYGLSSAGFGLFGSEHLFSQESLFPPLAPDGVAFGIASDDELAPANAGQAKKLSDPLIKSVVVFTLTDVPETFKASDISNVSFQYGTSLDDANITPSPSGVVGLASLGLMGGIWCLFRRLRRSVKRSWS